MTMGSRSGFTPGTPVQGGCPIMGTLMEALCNGTPILPLAKVFGRFTRP